MNARTLRHALRPQAIAWLFAAGLAACGGAAGDGDRDAATAAAKADAAAGGPPFKDAPAVTATPGTALHHAQTCQQHLGPIPTWACQDGVPIPVVSGGKLQVTTPSTCDNPDLKGQCVVGSYAGGLDGQNFDGSPNANVKWAYFCRINDNFAQMIGYNKQTGATCFFELKDGAMPLELGVPKGKVPGVLDANYELAWKPPAQIASQGCNGCHTPDPFIHTPYVDAARSPKDPAQPAVPQVASVDNPYFVVGDAFAKWTLDHVEFDQNKCTSCHRMPDFRRFTFTSKIDFNAHMPPLAPGSMKADFDAVVACLTQGPDKAPGCRWAALNGAAPAKDPVANEIDGSGSFQTSFGTLGVADPFAVGTGTLSASFIKPNQVTAVVGLAAAPTGTVQLDVIGHQAVDQAPAGIHFVARFFVPVASFVAGKVLDETVVSGTLFIAGADREKSSAIGPLVHAQLKLTDAGMQQDQPVAGQFKVTWLDAGK